MARAGRALALVLAVLLLLAALVLAARRPLAERAGEAALARAGIAAELTVDRLGAEGAVVRIGGEGPRGVIALRYDLRTLLTERRAETVIVRDLTATLRWSPEDGPTIDGVPLTRGGGGEGAAPLSRLVVEDAALRLVTPAGEGRVRGSGAWDGRTGQAALRVVGERLGTASARAEGLRAEARLSLTRAGLTLRATGRTDVVADGAVGGESGEDGTVRARGLAFDARAARASDAGALRGRLAFATDALSRGPRTAAASGTVDLAWADSALTVRAQEPVTVRVGATTLTAAPGADFRWAATGWRTGGTLGVEGPIATGDLAVSARQSEGGALRFGLEGALDALAYAGVEAQGVTVRAEGARDDTLRLAGALTADRLRHAGSGATVRDLTAPLSVTAGAAGTATELRVADGCAEAARLTLSEPDAALEALRVCEAALTLGPGGPSGEVALSAARLRVGLGDAALTGTGADARLTLRGAEQAPRLDLSAEAGSLRWPGFTVTDVEVSCEAGLGTPLDASFDLAARVAQESEAPTLAPVLVSGTGRLAADALRAALSLTTPGGAALGDATLTHDFAERRGAAVFDGAPLAFAPDGLQPTRIVPALRGIVSEASGTLTARARAEWGPDGLTSAGTLALADLSFDGPTVAIARTEGLTTEVALASLWPPRTAGTQTGTLRALDFGALRLTDGAFAFALDGDRVTVASARFPWMGGALTLEETEIGFAGGGRAVVALTDVSLGALLAAADVPGLTGEGVIGGRVPLRFDAFAVEIEDGRVESEGPGAIRYRAPEVGGDGPQAENTRLAFSALENLRYDTLAATVDGPLAGTLDFGVRFDGRGDLDLGDPRIAGRVTTPVIYRISVEAPLLSLLSSANTTRQIREAVGQNAQEERDDQANR